jgi:hypothetical protein
MAAPNASISEIAVVTLRNRRGKIADNILKNNAGLARIQQIGNANRKITGGSEILEEIAFAENGNASWYSGADPLDTSAREMFTAATYSLKQVAAAFTVTGLEELQNSGPEQKIDLAAQRAKASESTLLNLCAEAFYSDGTGYGGKQLPGLGAFIIAAPTSGSAGGIDRSNTWWRNAATGSLGVPTSANIQGFMNTAFNGVVRGNDAPDLILFGTTVYGTFEASLQPQQRFTDPKMAELGFQSLKYKGAVVVLDGGIGGNCPAAVGYMLNTKYIHWRPHKDRDVAVIGGDRVPVNQDAITRILAWAGAMTVSGMKYHVYFQAS